MTLSLDSNVVVDLFRPTHPQVRARFLEAREAGAALKLSTMALHELVYGAYRSARPDRKMQELDTFLPMVEVVGHDADDAITTGQVRAYLVTAGHTLATADLFIAAQASQRGWGMVTNNIRHLGRVPGLLLYDWRASDRPLDISQLIGRLTGGGED